MGHLDVASLVHDLGRAVELAVEELHPFGDLRRGEEGPLLAVQELREHPRRDAVPDDAPLGHRESEPDVVEPRAFPAESLGYTATKHQHEVGTGDFDVINEFVSPGQTATRALVGSTEEAQSH
jgi:hypothetical protein